jgi:hypothetical protein
MNGIPPGITGVWTRNPPKEWNSAGITASWTWIQTGKIKNLRIGNNSRNITLKDLYRLGLIFKNLNMKTSLK